MFAKLLKHEWQANRSLMGLLCAIIGISGLVTGGILRYMTWSTVTGNEFMVVAYTIILTAAMLAIFGCCIGAMYLLVYRFYKSRFTDQGYLMLTLPVTTHQQLLSSIVNTVISVALVGITALVSAAVGLSIFLISFEQPAAAELWQVIADSWNSLGEMLLVSPSWLAFKGLQLVIAFLADIVLFMLALTVGAQARKHPVLKGAAAYIGIDILVSEVIVLVSKLMEGALENALLWSAVFSCVIYGAVAVTAYFVMHRKIDKNLNLV